MLLRGTVFRLSVATGEPAPTTCSRCAAPLSGRLAVRCANCRGWFGVPFVLELMTAAVLALVVWRFAGHASVAGYAFLGAVGVALAAVDVAVQRLPDWLTLPLYPGLFALFTVAAVIEGRPESLLRALLGGLALGGSYLVLGILSRGQLGAGDVKLAGAVGIALGWLSWPTLLAGAALGFVLMGVASFGLLISRRVTLRHSLSFGPFLLGGALIAILTAV
jgi:leader peptidase (prepilin peptidase)/N-methyltransferase